MNNPCYTLYLDFLYGRAKLMEKRFPYIWFINENGDMREAFTEDWILFKYGIFNKENI